MAAAWLAILKKRRASFFRAGTVDFASSPLLVTETIGSRVRFGPRYLRPKKSMEAFPGAVKCGHFEVSKGGNEAG
jgi:hypothetical protein